MKAKIITLSAVIIIMCVIFMYSSQEGVRSDESSLSIVDEVVELYEVVNEQLNREPINNKEELSNRMNRIIRKSAHVFVYTLLSFFTTIHISTYYNEELINMKYDKGKGIKKQVNQTKQIKVNKTKWILVISSIITFLYACSDELHQHFVEGRSGNIVDVGIDSIGIILGVTLFLILYKLILRTIIFIINQF